MAKISEVENRKGMHLFWCPGCKCCHYIAISENDCGFPIWKWNGDVEKPTISPSIKVTYNHPKGYGKGNNAPIGWNGEEVTEVCHSFIRDGKIQYLSDCTHEFAGKTVDMVDFNDI